MGTIKTTNIEPIADNGTVTLGSSGDTFTVPSGVTVNMSSATQTGVGGANTPAFSAYYSSAQALSNETTTTLLFNAEYYDSASAYDTSTGKFTPQTAGKYFVHANVKMQSGGMNNYYFGFANLKKNTTTIAEGLSDDRTAGDARARTVPLTAIIDMNGSTDFFLVEAYISASSSGSTLQIDVGSTFQAYKIIE